MMSLIQTASVSTFPVLKDLCCRAFFSSILILEIVNLQLQENGNVETKTGPGNTKNESGVAQGNIEKAGRGTADEAQEAATETPLMRNHHHRA